MHRAVVPGAFDLLALHERRPERYPFLLESVAGHLQSGRWDILFVDPGEALIGSAHGIIGPEGLGQHDNFFAALDRWAAQEGNRDGPVDLPYHGGWFLYLGYEAARWSEPTLRLPASPHVLPDALAIRCRGAVIRDRQREVVHLLSEIGDAQLVSMRNDLFDAREDAGDVAIGGRVAESPPRKFLDGVQRIHEWLRAGDIFQANLSRAWDVDIPPALMPSQIYRRLRHSNPSPFAGLMRWGEVAVISSSPERLLRIDGGVAETRPIAGTRRRGTDPNEDQALRSALIGNLKERAEHVMLIDLERNDLGRVCRPGSVTVNELMTLETYAHVHHIVSNVRGVLREGVGPGSALKAVFPGGTITGCPKVRAMEIIAELEGQGRGPYTGSMGYLSLDGRLDTNILIRSLVWSPGHLRLRAGAGIVADSEAHAELEETRAKARGLLRALDAEA